MTQIRKQNLISFWMMKKTKIHQSKRLPLALDWRFGVLAISPWITIVICQEMLFKIWHAQFCCSCSPYILWNWIHTEVQGLVRSYLFSKENKNSWSTKFTYKLLVGGSPSWSLERQQLQVTNLNQPHLGALQHTGGCSHHQSCRVKIRWGQPDFIKCFVVDLRIAI